MYVINFILSDRTFKQIFYWTKKERERGGGDKKPRKKESCIENSLSTNYMRIWLLNTLENSSCKSLSAWSNTDEIPYAGWKRLELHIEKFKNTYLY